jgi:Rrf2 family protein
MFTLTKKADYGLSMLSVLALKGRKGRVNLKEMAEMGMPRAFMSKIAASLVEAGILNSREGRGGGYGLNYEPKEIQVREALEAIEGEVEPVTCAKCPMQEGCGQVSFMDKLTDDINMLLEKYTLEDLTK